VAVREKERLYWERLFDADFCIAGSVGVAEGDTIRITSGPLVGMESRIKKIDRHKREAVVEMEVMGAARDVRVMLEVVEKARAVFR
jgi:transcriptional antiterminator NusG